MSTVTAATPVARALPTAASAPAATATLPFDAGTVEGGGRKSGGGFSIKFDLKKAALFGIGGAVAGMLLPFIPGGPIGGALIGVGLSLFL